MIIMADTPVDNIEHWSPNEVITSSKMNKMVDALLYSMDQSKSAMKGTQSATDQATNSMKQAQAAQDLASQAQQAANTATDKANTAITQASNANTTADNALKKINDAVGGQGYASLNDANVLKGINTFNAQVTTNAGLNVTNGATIDHLQVDDPINGSLQTITPSDDRAKGINSVTQIANAIDAKAGVWQLSNNVTGLPGNIQNGMLIAFSNGMQSNSGMLLVSDKSNADTLYITYITNGILGDWKAIGNSKLVATIVSRVDANTLTKTGPYDVENIQSSNNFPAGVSNGTLWVIQGSNNGVVSTTYLTQLFQDQETGELYTRSCWDGRWTQWGQQITDNYLKTHNLNGNGSIIDDTKGTTSTSEITQAYNLNSLTTDGRYILSNSSIQNAPTDPDTNSTASGPFTVNVLANKESTIISQELVQVTKGYKYVRGFANNSWTSWSVLTPFS